MDPLEMVYDRMLFRYDRGIFEVFGIPPGALPEMRVPVRWLGVRVGFHKGRADKGSIVLGTVRSPDEPLYARLTDTKPDFWYASHPNIRVRPEEEPVLRDYFTQVATRADRTVH